MKTERIVVPTLPPPAGPYVHAVRHGDSLYLSGLTAHGGPAADGPIEAQVDAIFAQIEAIARHVGAPAAAPLKVTIFVTELTELDALRQALSRHYGDTPPASTLVQVAGLFAPGLKIEIEAVLAA
jgi:2-iminobutanoate/2-iminopropanoate deaminase